MPEWIVAISESGREAEATTHVARQGFDFWFPKIRKVSFRRGKRIVKIQALFPRYFFVVMADNWRRLYSTRGVVGVLTANEQPVLVRDAMLDDVRVRCDADGVYMRSPKERFMRGQSVTVHTGALAGLLGIYDGATAKREVALFNMLGGVRRVELPFGDLSAA